MLAAGKRVLRVAAAGGPEPSQLTVELWLRPPPLADLDQWDAVAELTFDSDEPVVIDYNSMWEAPPEVRGRLDAFVLSPGVYRVRAYGCKRDEVAVSTTKYEPDDPEADPSRCPEQHLLQLWFGTPEHHDDALVLKGDPRYIAY